jgi:hypothetical protein
MQGDATQQWDSEFGEIKKRGNPRTHGKRDSKK